MSIQRFFTNRVIIRRLTANGTYGKLYVATGTIDSHTQRIDESTSATVYGVAGATHKMWCDISENVRDGDRIQDSEGNEYEVVAVINEGFGVALNEHKAVLMRQYVPQDLPRE